MNILKELSNLPSRCIYGLFNDVDKKVYIGYTNNTIASIYSNISNLKYSNKDFNNLEFRVIEIIDTTHRLRIRYQFWSDYYSNIGWIMYRNYKAINYRIKIDVGEDFLKGRTNYYVYAKLVSRGYKELIVGVFEDFEKCNMFVVDKYSNITDIIYSDNSLTNEYMKNLNHD